MIVKSTKHSLKFTNKGKQELLNRIFSDYKTCLETYIQMIIDGRLPLMVRLPSSQLPIITLEHSKWRNLCYHQASGMIRSELKYISTQTFKKYKKVYKYFIDRGRQVNFTSKFYKELNINLTKRVKINTKNISIPLTNELFDINQSSSFDEFIRITSPYKTIKKVKRFKYQIINIPIKYHKHSNKLITQGYTRKNFIQLSKDNITLVYEKPDTIKKETGSTIAFDCGYKKLLSDSNNNHYGTHLEEIYKRLANKKRGSKSYIKLLQHKKNEINRVCNSLNLDRIQVVIIEDLKNVKYRSRLNMSTNNKMQYWSYKQVREKLEDRALQEGFYVVTVNPAYTSQTCSQCGVIESTNRDREVYSCNTCGLLIDADTNAAINILHRGVYSPSNDQEIITNHYCPFLETSTS